MKNRNLIIWWQNVKNGLRDGTWRQLRYGRGPVKIGGRGGVVKEEESLDFGGSKVIGVWA